MEIAHAHNVVRERPDALFTSRTVNRGAGSAAQDIMILVRSPLALTAGTGSSRVAVDL